MSGSISQLFTVTSVLFLKCRVGVPFIVLSEPLQSARFFVKTLLVACIKNATYEVL